MIVLIDNGHGYNTAGKCSPDKQHREYQWTRKFAGRLEKGLKAKGFNAQLLTPETYDVSIRERVKRVNVVCKEFGAKNCIVISIHNNAAGSDGKWHEARGYSSHVSMNASTRSKRLATLLAESVEAQGIKVRKPLPKQAYWPQNLGICRDTNCAAVLTENLFQDNREDVKLLAEEAFLTKLEAAYIEAITKYQKEL